VTYHMHSPAKALSSKDALAGGVLGDRFEGAGFGRGFGPGLGGGVRLVPAQAMAPLLSQEG
jgi:hypothetical protein